MKIHDPFTDLIQLLWNICFAGGNTGAQIIQESSQESAECSLCAEYISYITHLMSYGINSQHPILPATRVSLHCLIFESRLTGPRRNSLSFWPQGKLEETSQKYSKLTIYNKFYEGKKANAV